MYTTIKKEVEKFLGREVSEEDFCINTPEIIKVEIIFNDDSTISLLSPDLLNILIFNKTADGEQYLFDICYDNNIVLKHYDDKTKELTIKNVNLYNKSQVSITELIRYYYQLSEAANVFGDTFKFQKKFGLLDEEHYSPEFLSDDKMTMKIGHLKEELAEIEKAYENKDIVEVADGLMDLIYVAAGLANLMHLPCHLLWKDVQNSNMAYKERVTSLDNATKRGSTFDVRKTKDWIPPRGKEIIDFSKISRELLFAVDEK